MVIRFSESLFHVTSDPHQDIDVATQNAAILKDLNSYCDAWYQQAYAEFRNARYIHRGHQSVPEVILYASDWNGDSCDNPGHLALGAGKGRWDIEVETAGDYRVELRRWPFESGKALTEGAKGASDSGGARPIAKAQLTVASYNQTIATKPGDKSAAFTPHLKAGKTTLTANFLDRDEKILCGAFYVRVTRLAGSAGRAARHRTSTGCAAFAHASVGGLRPFQRRLQGGDHQGPVCPVQVGGAEPAGSEGE